ncbi:MAG TPA: hypothetical protein DEQ61_06875 [Streptomyces sp.]|nr:hypothetical protein [Streptomyces sp.]
MTVSAPAGYDPARVLETIGAVLRPGEVPYPRPETVDQHIRVLKGYLESLAMYARAGMDELPEDSPERAPRRDALEHAEHVMQRSPGCGLRSATSHSRALARAAERLLPYAEKCQGRTWP